MAHALGDVAAVQALDDAVHGAEQNAALAVDVGLELRLERGLERVRRAERDRPAEREIGRAAVDVLLHREAGVDAGAVDVLALHVEPPHGGAHALGAHRHDVDVRRELGPHVLQVADQEAVREAERGAGAERFEDLAVQLRLGGVGNEQEHEVRLLDDGEHLAQRAVLLGEAGLPRLGHRARARAQADLHLDAGALERVAQVLRLRRALRAPADDADLLDAREGLGQQGKQVPPTFDDLLGVAVAEIERVDREDLRAEAE